MFFIAFFGQKRGGMCEKLDWRDMNMDENENKETVIGDKTLADYLALPDDIRIEMIDGVFYEMAWPSFAH